ncbi:MAG: thiol peroxidase [Parafilimonas sp.]
MISVLLKYRIAFAMKMLCGVLLVVFIANGCFAQTASDTNDINSLNKKSNMENTNGTTITLGGNPVHTAGKLPEVGSEIKDFTLTGVDLQEKTLSEFKGKYIIMNIFPSVNTGICSKSVRKFNEEAASLQNTVVLCISKDLPFAQKAFCGAEGINNVVMLSDFRNDFGHTYGVQMVDGAMKGLLSRAVIVVNPEGKIVYEQQVPEIGQEPDYAPAIAAVK